MDEDIRAVEEAVATLESARAEHDPAAATLQSAVAAAITHGKPIREVAAAAHMTALEALDAADAVTYPQQSLQPWMMAQ
jgi:DNA-binding protein H-NS